MKLIGLILRHLLVIMLFIAPSYNLLGSHLMGGNLAYEYMGPVGGGMYRYKIILSVYNNCDGTSQIPEPVASHTLHIYDETSPSSSDKPIWTSINLPLVDSGRITSSLPGGCSVGQGTCVYEGKYEGTVDLPQMRNGALSKGYHLFFTAFARNNNILNLSSAGSEGMGFHAFIPPPIVENNSPVFSDVPLPFICVNDTTGILNTAIDPDGDVLTFSFVNPSDGQDTGPFDPLTWPLRPVAWATNYNTNAIFGTNGYQYIDGFTGYSEYMSPSLGNFVVTVEIKEFRNGSSIPHGITRRDLQLLIINCPANEEPVFNSSVQSPLYTIEEGDSLCFTMNFHDEGGDSLNLFISGPGAIFDPAATNPPATITAPISADSSLSTQFCWNTACGQGRDAYYTFDLKVEDNGCPPKTKVVVPKIKVNPFVGPVAITGISNPCPGQSGGGKCFPAGRGAG